MPVHDWTRVHAAIFHSFHLDWVVSISRVLNQGILARGTYSLLTNLADGVGPKVADLIRPGGGLEIVNKIIDSDLGVGDEPTLYAMMANTVSIRLVETHKVVAVVEIVSPGAKSNHCGCAAFVRKTKELIKSGIHSTVIDLFPPGLHDPQGIHPILWEEYLGNQFVFDSDKPLTCVSYVAGDVPEAFLESVAVGDTLPKFPLFLSPDLYVELPLESTYKSAFAAVPEYWRDVVEGRAKA